MSERSFVEQSLDQIDIDRQNYTSQSLFADLCGIKLHNLYDPRRFNDSADHLTALLHNAPTVAEAIITGEVTGFHGTTSATLHYVLSDGLLTAAEARTRKIPIATGERVFGNPKGQPSISFAEWCNPQVLEQYSCGSARPLSLKYLYRVYDCQTDALYGTMDFFRGLGATEEELAVHPHLDNMRQRLADTQATIRFLQQDPKGLDAELVRLNFPVLFGVKTADMQSVLTYHDIPEKISSHTVQLRFKSDIAGEFAVHPVGGALSFDSLPVTGVPEHYVSDIQGLVDDLKIPTQVVPIEPLITRYS